MHIYEYLFAAILIVLILLSSTTMIGIISEPTRSTSEKEQLKVTAQKTMTQILLDPGDPPDWGSDTDVTPNNLKTFGLAKYSETSREAYVLDPSKVLRLDSNISAQHYIPPSKVINLLNFGHDYGFALEFYQTLNVTVNPLNEVSVKSQEGLPVFNANVTARMYYQEGSRQIKSTYQINTTTGAEGKCSVQFGTLPENRILVLVVDYYGVRVTKIVSYGSNVKREYLLGKRLFQADGEIPISNAMEIMVHKKAGNNTIENVTYYATKENLEPTTVAVIALSTEGDNLIFASRLPLPEASETAFTYSSIQEVELSFPFAYPIERSVIICGCAYMVRLYIWRMSY